MTFLKDQQTKDFKILLVGNKSDLKERLVSFEDGRALAAGYEINFYETSALKNKNINEAFNNILTEIIN